MAELRILSWNICFGCMYADAKSAWDVTARVIAQYCKEKYEETGKHECLNNVIEFMNNGKFDLIGLQEVVDTIIWETVIENNKYRGLGKMAHVFHTVTFRPNGMTNDLFASMTTLYNINRFTLIATTYGNLAIDDKDGRPYQMLYLNEIGTNNKFLVINLHNGKFEPFHKKELEEKFSKFIELPVNVLDKSKNSLIIDGKNPSLKEIIGETIPHVICVGDFNDGPYQYKDYDDYKNELRKIENEQNRGKKLNGEQLIHDYSDNETRKIYGNKLEKFWEGLQLFKNSKSSLDKIIVNTKGDEPPKTCCTGKEFLRGSLVDGKLIKTQTSSPIFSNYQTKMQFNTGPIIEGPFKLEQIDRNDDGDKDSGDYILISDGLEYTTEHLTTHNVGASSDHKPVTCKVKVSNPHRDEHRLFSKGKSQDPSYKKKYLIYKNKYLKLKNLINNL